MRSCFLPLFLAAASAASLAETPVFRDPAAPPEQRVADLLARLTPEEKAALCSGDIAQAPAGRFESGGIPRLGVPRLGFRDGPQGVRTFDGTATTALPCGLSLASTWDVATAGDYARVLGEEMRAAGRQVLFGPGLDLARDPRGGRNFEYFGEDPLLTGTIGTAYIRGIQSRGVAACAKHLVANDEENLRHFTSSQLSGRTLREMHFLPFELAVRDGGVWSVMTGNNLIDGVHVSASRPILQELLKNRMGFDGVVLTDWRAAYDTVPTALAGTDLTSGLCAYVFGQGRLLAAVKAGAVSAELLDDKARRILRLYLRTGLLDGVQKPFGELDSQEHRATARRLAAAGMVLLKNSGGLLPLDPAKCPSLFVTGPGADRAVSGHGSGEVHSSRFSVPLAALRAAWGPQAKIVQQPWSEAARSAAHAADVALFFAVDAPHGEGHDLTGIGLPDGQAEAIAELAAVNPRVVVILQTGEPVLLEAFADRVPAIVAGWYAGQAAGEAMADVLTGASEPAGRLAVTFGRRLEDYPAAALGVWPARPVPGWTPREAGTTPEERRAQHGLDAEYREGVFIGYRWFDAHDLSPRYPFGFGLSYTAFEFSSLAVDASGPSLQVACTVKNTGGRGGAEVVQVYISPPPGTALRPRRELKGFAKVWLAAGETRRVTVPLRPSALGYFDASAQNWRADSGVYTVEVGASSRDIRLRSPLTLAAALRVDRY